MGHYYGFRRSGVKRIRKEFDDEVIDVPLLESLQQMLNNPSVLNEVCFVLKFSFRYIINDNCYCM